MRTGLPSSELDDYEVRTCQAEAAVRCVYNLSGLLEGAPSDASDAELDRALERIVEIDLLGSLSSLTRAFLEADHAYDMARAMEDLLGLFTELLDIRPARKAVFRPLVLRHVTVVSAALEAHARTLHLRTGAEREMLSNMLGGWILLIAGVGALDDPAMRFCPRCAKPRATIRVDYAGLSDPTYFCSTRCRNKCVSALCFDLSLTTRCSVQQRVDEQFRFMDQLALQLFHFGLDYGTAPGPGRGRQGRGRGRGRGGRGGRGRGRGRGG